MRKTTLVLNSTVVVYFVCFLAYTFWARQHLNSLARNFVTEKTLEYSKPIIEDAAALLDSPLVKTLASDEHLAAFRNEITNYRQDPEAYIADLAGQQAGDVPVENAIPMIEKLNVIKWHIRDFYDKTVNALIADLRIFSVSNLLAGLIAFGLAYRSTTKLRKPIVWFSFLMFVGVLYCSCLYVDDLTFFRILFRAHMGWRYAVFLSGTIFALYIDYGRYANATAQRDSGEAADSAVSSGESTRSLVDRSGANLP